VGALRKAIGPDIGLALDCHSRYDTESAIQIANAVAPFRPMWLEEPVPSDNPEAMLTVRRATRVPIACGENVYTRYGFRPFIEKQAVSIIQPDMAKCGGLLETRKIAAMAEVYGIPMAPTGLRRRWVKPLMHTSAPPCRISWCSRWGRYFNENIMKLAKAPQYAAGFLEVPDAPGIGVELIEDAMKELMMPGYQL
jgi:galactonate dehydratase